MAQLKDSTSANVVGNYLKDQVVGYFKNDLILMRNYINVYVVTRNTNTNVPLTTILSHVMAKNNNIPLTTILNHVMAKHNHDLHCSSFDMCVQYL